MYNRRRDADAAQRSQDRKQRENDAPRLRDAAPRLETLRITVSESIGSTPAVVHVRPIVVASAPALFQIPCHNRDCKEGGHDLTREIVNALQRGATTFDGTSRCDGSVGSTPCGSVLTFHAVATQRAER